MGSDLQVISTYEYFQVGNLFIFKMKGIGFIIWFGCVCILAIKIDMELYPDIEVID